jgi:hypothetical protein
MSQRRVPEDAMRSFLPAVVLLATVCVSTRAFAQRTSRSGAALVHAEGEVYLNDRTIESSSVSALLPDSVVVRTSRGRAVVALKRGGLLFLDSDTSVRVLANGVYNSNRIEVLMGSAIVASATSAPLVECENEIRLSNGGMFRFDLQRMKSSDERSCRFRVFEGAAAVPLVSVTNALRAGQSMMCTRRCGDMIPTMEFSLDQLDDFDQWARRMHERFGR